MTHPALFALAAVISVLAAPGAALAFTPPLDPESTTTPVSSTVIPAVSAGAGVSVGIVALIVAISAAVVGVVGYWMGGRLRVRAGAAAL